MSAKQKTKAKGGGKLVPALCNVFGILLLAVVVALCAPITIPQIAGYQVFNVISGSMEPEIPLGSVIYAKPVEPSTIQEGDVVAFYDGGGVIAHRVTTNRTSLGELVTKGDANEVEDFTPVPYEAVVGVVENSVPELGAFMSIYASTVGKVYLLLTAACGLMLNILASRMRRARREAIVAATAASIASGTSSGSSGRDVSGGDSAQDETQTQKTAKKRSGGTWRKVAAAILIMIFAGSGGVVGYGLWQYSASDALYSAATDKFTKKAGTVAPITVDFKALQKENPDIVGWIYCEGTPINYPVLQGKDNGEYLHNDYTGAYNIDGSIFVDADNTPGFVDSNSIIYGHHMNSGAMFACLEKWADQEFYEEHPVIWLLTPKQDYKVVLFSGHHVSAHSSWYDIYKKPGKDFDRFLEDALAESDFKADIGELNHKARYVQLSTCAYIFDDARYALHGVLVSVASAGGVEK